MTVKCLKPHTKQTIVNAHAQGVTIDYMATFWGKSRSTIIRVLEENDVDPGIKRRKRKAKPAPEQLPLPGYQIMTETAMEASGYSPLAIPPTNQPAWYSRFRKKVREVFGLSP